MTQKEKAQELDSRFYELVADTPDPDWRAKQGALIVIDEVLSLIDNQMKGWLDTDIIVYWDQVKQEIENK